MQEPQVDNESVEFEVKPHVPRLRGKTLGLAVLGLVVLVAAGVTALVLVGSAIGPDEPLAQVMPSNTILYFSMATHPEQQPNFEAVARAWQSSKGAEQIEDALSSALTFAGFDWEKDILPWLGDRVAAGLIDMGGYELAAEPTDSSFSPGRYREPFFVLAVQTRDKAKSDAFLADFRSQRESGLSGDSAIKDETYRDIPIVYVQNDWDYAPYGEAYATIDDVIVLTIGPDNLKQVIDTALDQTGLAVSENFKTTLKALPAPNVGTLYMDYAKYIDQTLAANQTAEIFYNITSNITGDDEEAAKRLAEQQRRNDEQRERMREMMQVLGGMGVAMTYEPGGIRFDMAMQYFPDRAPESMRALYNLDFPPASNRIFDSIPAPAVMALNTNFSMFAGTWQALLDNPDWLQTGFGNYPGAVDVAGQLEEFEQSAGVKLGADLFELFNGEFAFVLLPKAETAAPALDEPYSYFPRAPLELAAMLDASDAAHATDSLDKLLRAVIDRSGGGVSVQPLSGLPYSVLTDAEGGVVLAYGVVDGRLVIGSNSDTLLAIDQADQAALSADETFKTAMGVLPANRFSSGYVQLQPIWDWMASSMGSQPCEACDYLRPFKWLSLASETPDKAAGLQRGMLYLALEPAK
ncbi:MAG TPA: DUF3352 domain-containing protein [Anaerolineae bacterium]|nr:DUF3352 domain-containing protein [Anaerolineae bacterium]